MLWNNNYNIPAQSKTFLKILLIPWIIVSCIYSTVVLVLPGQCNLYDDRMIIITMLSLLLLLLLLLYITFTIIIIVIVIIIKAEFSSGC